MDINFEFVSFYALISFDCPVFSWSSAGAVYLVHFSLQIQSPSINVVYDVPQTTSYPPYPLCIFHPTVFPSIYRKL